LKKIKMKVMCDVWRSACVGLRRDGPDAGRPSTVPVNSGGFRWFPVLLKKIVVLAYGSEPDWQPPHGPSGNRRFAGELR
jgi:hypothetical protein